MAMHVIYVDLSTTFRVDDGDELEGVGDHLVARDDVAVHDHGWCWAGGRGRWRED